MKNHGAIVYFAFLHVCEQYSSRQLWEWFQHIVANVFLLLLIPAELLLLYPANAGA